MNKLSKHNIVDAVLKHAQSHAPKGQGRAYAPVNFALIKYWGKEEDYENIMLPKTGSLSISMGKHMGTKTRISRDDHDSIFLNDAPQDPNDNFSKKLWEFVDLFRTSDLKLRIETQNTVPTAAGLASSASGFAALTLALNDFMSWGLSPQHLSILARLGSGSAARSIYQDGFVELIRGESDDPLGTYARPITHKIDALYIGILNLDTRPKKVSSTDGMKKTVLESTLYKNTWAQRVEDDLRDIKNAINANDFSELGRVSERNAIAMHATAKEVGVNYSYPETLKNIEKIQNLRSQNIDLYFTQDAGPNLKILAKDSTTIQKHVPSADIFKLI